LDNGLAKKLKKIAREPEKEVHFILHWVIPKDGKQGFFSHYFQNVFQSAGS